MFSVSTVLVLIAFALTLFHGVTGKPLLWVAVLLVCIALLVGSLAR
jgi:hypothetical protein